jgi:lipopolysaccharide biosynthesis glycosyltransferase
MNLLFCINGGYTGPLLDCLSSIVLHGGEPHYEVYLLSSDLCEEAQQALLRQVPKAVTLHFIAVPRELFEGFPETGRYPQEIYYRLAAASPGAGPYPVPGCRYCGHQPTGAAVPQRF